MAGKIEITLKRSLAGKQQTQRAVIHALGLKRRGQKVVHDATPGIQGMVTKVAHLVEVKEV